MDVSVRALRWRRRRYSLLAYRRRLLRVLQVSRVTLPGGVRAERREYWFWRVRLGLWIVLAVPGWLVLGWQGVIAGAAAGGLAELVVSYRWTRGIACEPGPGGLAGVREPRLPPPAGSGEAAELTVD
jgi:hypothetical protein